MTESSKPVCLGRVYHDAHERAITPADLQTAFRDTVDDRVA
jgi:hypothetical protein